MFVGTDRDPAKPLIVSGGRYIDRLERRDGRWAIVARVCLVEWQSEADVIAAAGGGRLSRHRPDGRPRPE